MADQTAPASPNLLHSYLFWTYERGSIHYDVMVTLILIFLFVSPRLIDFGDKPVTTVPLRSSEVLVKEAGTSGSQRRFIYEIRASQSPDQSQDQNADQNVAEPSSQSDRPSTGLPSPAQTEADRRAAILRMVEPISGEVTLDHYEPILDAHGRVVAYDAYILR